MTETSVKTGLPVARVAIDSPLPHLDRPFDYLVPPELSSSLAAGSRVRVRFAGRLVDGWVLERRAASGHPGTLSAVQRGLGDEPVLTPETQTLFRAVADRWAGTFADVVRLGVPARHARAEAAESGTQPPEVTAGDQGGWSAYRAGAAFLAAAADGRPARAVWNVLPGDPWAERVAELARACLAAGRGVIVVVPDGRDIDRADRALSAVLPKAAHVVLSSQLGPEARYRRWLSVRRGAVQCVVGNRSAIFAPVQRLGLIVVFDDGDDLLAEPRAPYPHARDVAVLRSSLSHCALLIGGAARTAESALLLESGWAHEIVADRAEVRRRAPRIVATGDDLEIARDPVARSARLPALAFRAARGALDSGRPVLVQVARRGHTPTLGCAVDRTPVRCSTCHGPVGISSGESVAACRWCGRPATDWACPVCRGTKMRAAVVGSIRTADELGRAFPSITVRTSSGEAVLADLSTGPAIVIATPGAEPEVPGGYGAVLLLDGWSMLSRPDLRASEETLRRWLNAAGLAAADGTVVVGADASLAPVQALIRWDPSGHAARELADRQALGFPPVSRFASLTGAQADVARLLGAAQLPSSAQELGSVPIEPKPSARRSPAIGEDPQVRTLVRVSRADGAALAEALHAAAATSSAKKAGRAVRIALDPLELW